MCAAEIVFSSHALEHKIFQLQKVIWSSISWPKAACHCCHFYRDSCRCRQRNHRLHFSFGTRDFPTNFLFNRACKSPRVDHLKNSFFLCAHTTTHRQPPKWMPHCCLPWKICSSKRIKRICCKRVAQRLERHRCRYLHAVRPFQISAINSIYRQHRWHRTPAKRTIITVPLPISWTHWISIHLRIYCERFVPAFAFFSVEMFESVSECAIKIGNFVCVWVWNQIECIWL